MQSDGKANSETVDRLVKQVRDGSSDAFAALAKLYAPLLSAELARYRGDLSDSDFEDLRQGAMIAFYRAALSYDAGKAVTFGLYAKICITNGILDALRSIDKLKSREISSDDLFPRADDAAGENPQQLFLDRQQVVRMYKCIRGLLSPLEYRIFAFYMAGFSYTEIAEKLERPPKSVDNALTRIKQKIKNKVNFSAD